MEKVKYIVSETSNMTKDFPTSFKPECGKPYTLNILILGGLNSMETVKNTFYFGIADLGVRDDYMRQAKSHLFMGIDSNGILRAYTVPVAKKIGEVPIHMSDGGDDEPAYQTIRALELKDLNLSFLEEDYAIGRINQHIDLREELSCLLKK